MKDIFNASCTHLNWRTSCSLLSVISWTEILQIRSAAACRDQLCLLKNWFQELTSLMSKSRSPDRRCLEFNKITDLKGMKGLKEPERVWNDPKQSEMVWDVLKDPERVWNSLRWYKMHERARKGLKWFKTVWDSLKWSERVWKCVKWSERSWNSLKKSKIVWDQKDLK